ncbi:hypothetical protein BDV93DRAFT_558435 [Ceratobasidium sp. AG-I]|nr:hypothetical protein BDV93DRAFT_558435 [Ceratobasidium sp. AG-I]
MLKPNTLVLSLFVAHQYVAYAAFCIEPATSATEALYPRPWCASLLPTIYGFVQLHYWDVGFLRYWTVAQIPNFIVAAAMLVLLGVSTPWFPSAVCVVRKQAGGGGRVDNSKSNTTELWLISTSMVLTLLPYALHALALSMILFTSVHVQIAIRVLPVAMPWAAWASAALVVTLLQEDQTRKCFVVGGPRDEGACVKPGGETESEGSFAASRVGREVKA